MAGDVVGDGEEDERVEDGLELGALLARDERVVDCARHGRVFWRDEWMVGSTFVGEEGSAFGRLDLGVEVEICSLF